MFKRKFTIIATTLFAAVAAPAFADDAIGSAVDGVLNPNGKEVAQTVQGVGNALGSDVWYVQGGNARIAKPTVPDERPTRVTEPRIEPGHAYSVPAFGAQAGA